MVIDYQLSYKAKTFILIYVIFLVSCEVKKLSIEIKESKKEKVILYYNEKYGGFWSIGFPFKVVINNNSNQERGLSYYKYYYNEKKGNFASLYYYNNDFLIRDNFDKIKIIKPNSTKEFVLYSKHFIDMSTYHKNFFDGYKKIITTQNIKDSIQIESFDSFRNKYPDMVSSLLSKDSISFNFPRLDQKNKFDVIKIPVPF